MAESQVKASLSKGRSGWCVIFRHPVCRTPDGKQSLRVRRGLGTREETEGQRLVNELNEILADVSFWTPAARAKAALAYDKTIVAAFYDHLEPERRDGWADHLQEVRPSLRKNPEVLRQDGEEVP